MMNLASSRGLIAAFAIILSANASTSAEGVRDPVASSSGIDTGICQDVRLEEKVGGEMGTHRENLLALLRDSRSQGKRIQALRILSPPEFRKEALRALTEAHLEGDLLVERFQKLLDEGRTLEEIQRSTSVYAKLQALRILRENLEDAVRESFEKELRARFHQNVRDGGAESFSLWSRVWASHVAEELQDTLEKRGVNAAYHAHVFGELQAEVIRSGVSQGSCWPRFDADADAVIPAERVPFDEARKGLRRLRGSGVIRVSQFVDGLSGTLELAKQVEAVTRKYSREQIHYPDVGTPGNITGNTFPDRVWAISYDDGPGPFTETLLDELKNRNHAATFFVQGSRFGSHPGLVKRISEAGHSVNSHSHSHPQIPKLDAAGMRRQIPQAVQELEKVLGHETRFYRLPFGAGVSVSAVRKLIKDAGLIHAFWNVDTLDWQIKTIDGIVENTQKQIQALASRGRNRGLILFHDVHQRTVGHRDESGRWVRGASLRVIDDLAMDPAVRFMTLDRVVDELNRR